MSSRKNEILALARTLFADRGYAATSMRQSTGRSTSGADTVQEGVQDGSIDPDIDPEYMVRIIASALNGMLDQSRFLMRAAPTSPLGGAEHLKRCLVAGITTATKAGGSPPAERKRKTAVKGRAR